MVKGEEKKENVGSKNIIKISFVQIWTKLLHNHCKVLDFCIFVGGCRFAGKIFSLKYKNMMLIILINRWLYNMLYL